MRKTNKKQQRKKEVLGKLLFYAHILKYFKSENFGASFKSRER